MITDMLNTVIDYLYNVIFVIRHFHIKLVSAKSDAGFPPVCFYSGTSPSHMHQLSLWSSS